MHLISLQPLAIWCVELARERYDLFGEYYLRMGKSKSTNKPLEKFNIVHYDLKTTVDWSLIQSRKMYSQEIDWNELWELNSQIMTNIGLFSHRLYADPRKKFN